MLIIMNEHAGVHAGTAIFEQLMLMNWLYCSGDNHNYYLPQNIMA
jgi:hypothetical protein